MSFWGLLIGLGSFLIIGLLHPVVIRAEYAFGTKCWPLFAVAGAVCCVASVLVGNGVLSILMAVLGFSLFWSIGEIFEQKKRVEKGWFPKNPQREESR